MGVTANNVNVGQSYEETIKALSLHGEAYCQTYVSQDQFNGPPVPYTNAATSFTAPKGLISVDLRKFDDVELRMVGLNTANNASPGVLELNWDAAPGFQIDATTFAIVEASWQMDQTGARRVTM